MADKDLHATHFITPDDKTQFNLANLDINRVLGQLYTAIKPVDTPLALFIANYL